MGFSAMPGLLFRMWPPISRIRFNIIKNGHSRRNISKFFKITMSNTMSDIFFTPYCNPFFVRFRKYESPTEIEPAHGHPLQIGIPYGDMLSISAHQRLYRHRILSKPVRASISVTCGDAPVPRKPVRASISVTR